MLACTMYLPCPTHSVSSLLTIKTFTNFKQHLYVSLNTGVNALEMDALFVDQKKKDSGHVPS